MEFACDSKLDVGVTVSASGLSLYVSPVMNRQVVQGEPYREKAVMDNE